MAKRIVFKRPNGSIGHIEGDFEDVILSNQEPEEEPLYPVDVKMEGTEETTFGIRKFKDEDDGEVVEPLYPVDVKMK